MRVIDSAEDLPTLLRTLEATIDNGAIVFLGAGSITQWANGLEVVMDATEGRT